MKRYSFCALYAPIGWTAVGFLGLGWFIGCIGLAIIAAWLVAGFKYGEHKWGEK